MDISYVSDCVLFYIQTVSEKTRQWDFHPQERIEV